MKSREFFIVAAEESANQYASRLIRCFKESPQYEDVRFSGIGFKSLESNGFKRVFPAERLSVMGALEVLKKWKTVKEAFSLSAGYILKNKPAAVLLIDFGGFNLKLAAEIKKKSPETKILYFISPKLWVWGAKRALKVKAFVDEMYVIHPFEVDFYKNWGVQAKFVGHPLLQELKGEYFDHDWLSAERRRLDFSKEQKVLGVLLGSRPSEIKRHKSVFVAAVQLLTAENPNLGVAFIVPPSKTKKAYEEMLEGCGFDFELLQSSEPMEKMALCDICLVASGTATLQLGLLGIPMAIAYRMNPITMFLAKKFATGVKFAGLVNIISGREISKEFIQEEMKPEKISRYLNSLLQDESLYKQTRSDLLALKAELGTENTYENLFNELIRFL